MIEVILFIAGILSGFINSIAAGGALLAFPAMLLAGLAPLTAAITGFVMVAAGQISATLSTRNDLKQIPLRYIGLLIPYLAGGLIGVLILNSTSSDTFNKIVPFILFVAVFVFIFQPYLQKHIHRPAHMRKQFSDALVWAGVFIVAIYAGYFGIGAGLMVLTLIGFSRIKNLYQMIALKNLIVTGLALSASIFFAFQDKIAWKEAAILAAGSMIGGFIGAKFTHRISERSIRIMVSMIGVALVAYAFIKF
jgi:uncharacterized protein